MQKRLLKFVFCALAITLFAFGAGHTFAETLFFDDFKTDTLKKSYTTDFPKMAAGKDDWVMENGILSQRSKAQGDMSYAVITAKDFPQVITIQAKVRIDEWGNGDTARGGVAVRVGLDNGQGYTFLFHNDNNTVQFLDDWRKWGKPGVFPFKVKDWYWFQLNIDEKDVLHGKVWKDGDKEPKDWTLEQSAAELAAPIRDWKKRYPALNGGTSPHGGFVTVSFDEVHVWDAKGPTLPVEPSTKTSTTWGNIKKVIRAH